MAETGFYRFLCEYVLTVIYFCDQICIFSIITPVFRVTWSSEIIIICCSRNISDYYWCWKPLIFLWKLWCMLFVRIHGWTERSKDQHVFEIEMFCHIMNVFSVTVDGCKASGVGFIAVWSVWGLFLLRPHLLDAWRFARVLPMISLVVF